LSTFFDAVGWASGRTSSCKILLLQLPEKVYIWGPARLARSNNNEVDSSSINI